MNVLLTCPRDLLFLLGVTVDARPGRRDPMSAVVAAAHELGGPVTHRKGRLAIELPDPVDAVLGLRALQRALPEYAIQIVSLIASEASVELLDGDGGPVRVAWQWLRDDIEPLLETDPLAETRGLCALHRFRQRSSERSLARLSAPAAIVDQQLPTGGLVLWSVAGSEPIVHVERSPFVVGRDHEACDLAIEGIMIARRHVQFELDDTGDWLVRDLQSPSGFYINEQFGGDFELLQPGMVVHFALPYALVVLSTDHSGTNRA